MKNYRSLGICFPLLLCFGISAAAQDDQKAGQSLTIRLLTNEFQVAADGSNVQTLHVEVRATNDAGALRVGQTNIPYDTTTQEIAIVDAHTLKADGKSVPVDAAAIYDQAPPGLDPSMVTGLRAKLIVFPQFTVGDTAVYTAKITTKHANFANQFIYGEMFPRTAAYEDVREIIIAPKTFPLSIESHDVDFSRREDGANVTYSWRYSAPKPIAEEPLTLSPLDHTPRFFASSFKDYAQLGRAYAALAEQKRMVTPKIRALADEVTAGTSDPKAQTQKLYEWVSSHIRYVAIELGTGSFVPHDVDSIVANGYGDCKDHDILLQALLKAKGIDSESVLVNGSTSYSMTGAPTFTTLNHVITFVRQFNLYLDSSAATAPFGILPLQEYGKPMVLASPASPGLGKMPVLQPGVAKINLKTVSVLGKDGVLTGTTAITASGPYAIMLRQVGLSIQATGPAAATRMLEAMGYDRPSGSFTQSAPTGFAPEHTISASYKALGWEDNLAGKRSFFIPGGVRLLGLSGDGVMGPFNPGNMSPNEPTVCYSAEESEDLSLKAPPGYQFSGLPADVRIETPNILFVAHWSLNGDTINVHRDFTGKTDEPLCSGAVRARSAAALKLIADSYDAAISFAKRDGDGGDKVANAALPFFNSGLSHLNAGEYELAIADFNKAVAIKSDDFDSYMSRGFAYSELRDYAQAVENYDQALKLKSDAVDAFGARGYAYKMMHRYDTAIADYGKAIALRPAHATYYDGRGECYLRSRQYDAAITDFDKAVALDPDGSDSETRYWLRGVAKATLERYPAAIADFDKALQRGPENVDYMTARGMAYFQAKNFQRAIVDFDKVLAQKPDAARALFYRGGARTKLGQKKEGESDIMAAIKLDPALGR